MTKTNSSQLKMTSISHPMFATNPHDFPLQFSSAGTSKQPRECHTSVMELKETKRKKYRRKNSANIKEHSLDLERQNKNQILRSGSGRQFFSSHSYVIRNVRSSSWLRDENEINKDKGNYLFQQGFPDPRATDRYRVA